VVVYPADNLWRTCGMSDFRKLRVWISARELAKVAYRVAAGMRGPGSVALRDQIVRAALSVPSNIVEGTAHENPREVVRFLQYSIASASEVEGHIQVAADLSMISARDLTATVKLVEEVRMMLYGFIRKVNDDSPNSGS
jgi:four helix bundle protein